MKRAVVTGATGFVGQNLVKNLVSNGYRVNAVIKPGDTFSHIDIPGVEPVFCELEDFSQLPALLAGGSEIDTFYHLAWVGSAGSLRADYKVQSANVQYTCDALVAADKLKCAKFVGAGSIMEDECSCYVPMSGVSPSPNYIYSCAKLTAHYFCKSLASSLNIRFCWAKISNAFGEGDVTGRFMDSLIQKLLKGKDCELTEGLQTYDFLYVTDVAEAFRRIGEKGKDNCCYYIGSGSPKPLKEFIRSIHEIVNSHANLNFGAVPFQGISLDASLFDAAPLTRDTGFIPKVSFEEGVKKTMEWIKDRCSEDEG